MDNQSISLNATQAEPFVGIAANARIALYGILLVWSLLGNVFVIAVVFANEELRTNFNYLIVNMAVSDLFIPLIALPIKIAQEVGERHALWLVDGILGNVLCKLCYFLTDISPAVSVFSLIVMSIHRFVAVVFPVRVRRWFNKKTHKIFIVGTWVAAMVLFSPYFYTFRLSSEEGFVQCIFMWTPAFDDQKAQIIFISLSIVIVFIVPFMVISVLYSIIIVKLGQISKGVATMLNSRHLVLRKQKNKQIVRMSLVIIAAFVILWGPFYSFFFVINFIWVYDIPLEVQPSVDTIFIVVQFIGYLNSAVNPCIYFLFLANYRKGLERLFTSQLFSSRRHRNSLDGTSRASHGGTVRRTTTTTL